MTSYCLPRYYLCLNRTIVVDDILCHSCRLSIYRKGLKHVSNPDKEGASPSDNKSINNDPTFELKLKSNDKIPYFERMNFLFSGLLQVTNIVASAFPRRI